MISAQRQKLKVKIIFLSEEEVCDSFNGFGSSFCFPLCLLIAATARSQTFATDDSVLQNLWNEAMTNSQLPKLAHELLDVIGPRLVGTPQMQKAHDWAVAKYAGWGITARNEQWGKWRGWERGVTPRSALAARSHFGRHDVGVEPRHTEAWHSPAPLSFGSRGFRCLSGVAAKCEREIRAHFHAAATAPDKDWRNSDKGIF
jgi:hypothetical protein